MRQRECCKGCKYDGSCHKRVGMNIIGDGGHADVVRDVLSRKRSGWSLSTQGATFIAIGDNETRKLEAERNFLAHFGSIISVDAIVSDLATYGEGTLICEGAIVQSGARIGKHVIVNAGAVVCHDCVLEDYVHIAPGAHLCGGVHVGEGTLVGTGVCVAPNTIIPAWSLCKAARLDIVPL